MIVKTQKIGGATIETADNAFAGAGAAEIQRRHALFDRALRETLLQIQRDGQAKAPREGE